MKTDRQRRERDKLNDPHFRAGHVARMAGVNAGANPHSEDASESEVRDAWTHWRDGWEAANERADAPPVRYSRPPDSMSEALIRANSLNR